MAKWERSTKYPNIEWNMEIRPIRPDGDDWVSIMLSDTMTPEEDSAYLDYSKKQEIWTKEGKVGSEPPVPSGFMKFDRQFWGLARPIRIFLKYEVFRFIENPFYSNQEIS